jgi:nuclear pore complex protein Nup93
VTFSASLVLQVIQQLKLLPLVAGETVEQKVALFRTMEDEVRRCLPDLLLASMSLLYSQYCGTNAPSSRPVQQDGGQDVVRRKLRRQARTLITFAGMVPYQLPGDTNARLVQLEALMTS